MADNNKPKPRKWTVDAFVADEEGYPVQNPEIHRSLAACGEILHYLGGAVTVAAVRAEDENGEWQTVGLAFGHHSYVPGVRQPKPPTEPQPEPVPEPPVVEVVEPEAVDEELAAAAAG